MNAPGANDTRDKTRELQRKLYRAAKRSPTRRFHALYDKIYRSDILERAWEEVRRNRGAPGVDGVTIAQVESQGVEGSSTRWRSSFETAPIGRCRCAG